jgi:hypothetical protein
MNASELDAQAQGSYACLADFYNANLRRLASRELDIGLWWREHSDDPLHRAAWVQDTGELYLVRSGRPEDGGGGVELLAVVASRAELDDALAGWREYCGQPSSLSWLRAHAARLRAVRRARRLPVPRRTQHSLGPLSV